MWATRIRRVTLTVLDPGGSVLLQPSGVYTSSHARRPLLQPLHQIDNPTAQGIGQDLQRLEGDVALPALNLADVRAMQPRTVGEHVL
jgi:hypothetical protein